MPGGKPAGMPCVQLTRDLRCALFDDARRPAVCASLAPEPPMCGDSREHALRWLARIEQLTMPLAGPADREAAARSA